MIKKLHQRLLFLVVFSIIIQTGKHFWPQFSLVDGIRVDYLSPTLYFSDTLIVAFILTSLIVYKQKFLKVLKKINLAQLLFFLLILSSTLLAYNLHAAIFGVIKMAEFVLFAVCIAMTFQKKNIKALTLALLLSSIIVSFIAVLQIVLNHSLNGAFYFLGERSFISSTIGVAKFSLNDQTIVRPYATFAHPNVLAFFIFFAGIILSFNARFENGLRKALIYLSSSISFMVLIFTFSRVITLSAFIYIFYLFSLLKAKKITYLLLFVITLTLFLIFEGRYADFSSIYKETKERQGLSTISVNLIKESPIFGVGVNNFFVHEIKYQKEVTPVFLQPVHNIYLYLFSQIGLVAGVLVMVFIFKTLKQVRASFLTSKSKSSKAFYTSIFIVLIAALCTGLFDHFLLTLQQAQIMLALTLGLCWNRNLI